MASKLEVYNQALVIIGDSPLLVLDGTTIQERRLNRFYDSNRKSFIEQHRWKFASTRAQLTRNAVAPAFGWKYAYDKPVDNLRLLNVFDGPDYKYDCGLPDIIHEQERGQVLTDAEEVYVLYLIDVAPEAFPETAARALAANLAVEVCIEITELQSKLDTAERTLDKRLKSARYLNGRRASQEHLGPYTWDTVRRSGHGVPSRNVVNFP